MPKTFSWSWSRLKNFRTCPKRHWHVDIQKDFKEEEGEALRWGNELHKAMAERVADGVVLPPTMQGYDDWATRVGNFRDGGKILVENKLAMDEQFRPTSFFDNKTWFRGVVDVLILLPPARRGAVTIDWKTGKVHPEFEQLALSAQLVFAHYPEIDKVLAVYAWLGHDDQTTIVYRREDMVPTWNKLWPEINVMKESFRTTTYPPKPSGICVNWCPVTSCPHHGKGSR
jgi:hypothetical protein